MLWERLEFLAFLFKKYTVFIDVEPSWKEIQIFAFPRVDIPFFPKYLNVRALVADVFKLYST